MINDRKWQVFWLTFFLRPSHLPSTRETVAGVSKSLYQGLQLRVQLRFRTGFPISPGWRNPTLEPFPEAKVRNFQLGDRSNGKKNRIKLKLQGNPINIRKLSLALRFFTKMKLMIHHSDHFFHSINKQDWRGAAGLIGIEDKNLPAF
jgi:hypothetical protein